MNYAFKMIAVVMALGVVVLQGCQNQGTRWGSNYVPPTFVVSVEDPTKLVKKKSYLENIKRIQKSKNLTRLDIDKENINRSKILDDIELCEAATLSQSWVKNSVFVNEAKYRNFSLDYCLMKRFEKVSDKKVCKYATIPYIGSTTIWARMPHNAKYVIEAQRRGLDCGVKDISIASKTSSKDKNKLRKFYSNLSSKKLCYQFKLNNHYDKFVKSESEIIIINEVKRRGLDCGIKTKDVKVVKTNKNQIWTSYDLSKLSITNLCVYAQERNEAGFVTGRWSKIPSEFKFVKEAIRRGLNCGVKETKNTFASIYKKSKRQILNEIAKESKNQISQNIIASKPKTVNPIISSSELDAERKKRLELERKLAAIETKQKKEQQKINSDNQKPIINAFAKQDGSNAIISGRVTDNIEIAEVLIDGQVQRLKSNGTFETPFYIPRTGKTIEIVAFDIKGNRAYKILKLERGEIQSADKQQFKSLNPSLKRVKANSNALALIIGISDYENTKASALYADSDAKMFYDYANLKLGIPSSNIKELVNDSAERIDITRAIKSWLLKRTVTDKTDIYVFFAGHGLATDDGKDVYLLPYDGVPDLLEDSSIKRKELFADIQATKPRSVTVFLDTCYSGGTRNEEETLVASLRPIIITAKEQSVPDNFTVLSAAQGNQTSQSLEEVKHGLFSYYTMLGMEGGADSNNDNKITARELHAFIKDKVERQSQFRQTPELQGDKDRVLVQFN